MQKSKGRQPKAAPALDPVVVDQVQDETKVEASTDQADIAPVIEVQATNPLEVRVRNNGCRDYYEPSSRTEIVAGGEVVICCATAMQKTQVLANIRQLNVPKNHLEVIYAE